MNRSTIAGSSASKFRASGIFALGFRELSFVETRPARRRPTLLLADTRLKESQFFFEVTDFSARATNAKA